MMNFLRHFFLKDLGLKLFSLFLAVLIWLPVRFAVQQQTPLGAALGLVGKKRPFRLPVVVVSSTVDARRFKTDPADVEVTVQGSASLIDTLQSAEIRAMVVFTGAEAAAETVKKIEVSTPPGVTCLEVNPAAVTVRRTE